MRLAAPIGLLGIASAAAVIVLGGCGGGDSSSRVSARLHELESSECDTSAIRHQLRALKAGVSAARSEFDSPDDTPARQRQILRSMEENTALINRQLPSLENCPERALPIDEGKSVPEPTAPPAPRGIAIGRRLGPPRIEPGRQGLPASPCSPYGKNGTTTVYIYPETSGCARVAPGEHLRIANLTGIGSPAEAVSVRVFVGDYELWLGPGQEGVIPAPVQTYFGRGTHLVRAIGGIGPTVLLLPRACAIRPPAEPGEELCFRRP